VCGQIRFAIHISFWAGHMVRPFCVSVRADWKSFIYL
jgi:hypothetical protein